VRLALNDAKSAMRRAIKARVASLSARDRVLAAQGAAEAGRSLAQEGLWLSYMALPDELNLALFMAQRARVRWVLPRVVGASLVLHEVTGTTAPLVEGAYGIVEPNSQTPERQAAIENMRRAVQNQPMSQPRSQQAPANSFGVPGPSNTVMHMDQIADRANQMHNAAVRSGVNDANRAPAALGTNRYSV